MFAILKRAKQLCKTQQPYIATRYWSPNLRIDDRTYERKQKERISDKTSAKKTIHRSTAWQIEESHVLCMSSYSAFAVEVYCDRPSLFTIHRATEILPGRRATNGSIVRWRSRRAIRRETRTLYLCIYIYVFICMWVKCKRSWLINKKCYEMQRNRNKKC